MPYYFRDRDKVYGPYTAKQVQSMRENGLLNNLTPFAGGRQLSQRVNTTAIALASLLAIILLSVCAFALLQKPLPTPATTPTIPTAIAGNSPINNTAPAVPSVAPADNGASETPGEEAEIPDDDETATESTDDAETPIESTGEGEGEGEGETYYKLDDSSGGSGSGSGSGDSGGGGSASATASVFGVLGTGRRFVFLLDRSSSMTGQPFDAARNELIRAISELNEKQQINVIAYDHDFITLFPKLTPASNAKKTIARNSLNSLAPRGGTEIVNPLIAAVKMKPDVIFVITDAQITISEAAYRQILQLRRNKLQIHVIQFGGFDSPPLQRLARETGGSFVKHTNF